MAFRDRLIEHYGFTERDWAETASRFETISLPAKSLFLESGMVATRLGYLRRGLMRSFFYDDQANDITTLFFLVGTINVAMDEIYFSRDAERVNYGINPTSVNLEISDPILIYPVPAREMVFIKGIHVGSTIKVFSTDGKLISQSEADSDLSLDISDFKSGMYFFSITSGKSSFRKRVVVE